MIEQHKNLSETIVKKGFRLYLFSFIIAPIGYIIKIIVSNELSVSDVGVLYGVLSLIMLVSAYNDFGMSESINHFVPDFITKKRYDKVKSILTYALIAQMSTGISIALLFFLGADWLGDNYFKSESASDVLKIFCLYFVGINLFEIIHTFFMSVQNTFYNKIVELVRIGFSLLFTMIFLIGNLGNIINYSYAWILGLYLGLFIAIGIFYKKYFLPYLKEEKIIWEKKFFMQILKYALLVFLGAQAATLLAQVDMQMIIYMLGTEDAGYYTNYLSIIGIPVIIIGPIFALLFPLFSELHSKEEHGKIKLVKQIFTNNFLLIGIASNIFLFVFALPITYVLFGEKFLMSGVILQWSILFLIFIFLLQMNFNILAGVGRVGVRAKIISVAILINIITNRIFIKLFGVAGAGLATGLGWVIIWGLSEYALGKEYKTKIAWKNLIKNTCVLGGIGGLIFYVYKDFHFFISTISRGGGFFILLVIAIIYFGIFILINYTAFKNFILEIKKIRGK